MKAIIHILKKLPENMKRIGLFLMTEKGFTTLRALITRVGPEHICFVVGGQDDNVINDYHNEIASLCKKHDIKFFNRNHETLPDVEYVLAISWRWLIKDSRRLIVLHDSLLPKYRGFAPLPAALINGEKHVGVTAIFAKKEFDTGEIISQRKIKIHYPIKIQQVIESISKEYADLVVEITSKIITGKKLSRRTQNEKAATYSLWRDENDYRINWSEDASHIRRFVDAVGYPYAGAASVLNGRMVRVIEAIAEPDVRIENRTVGKVIFMNDGLHVVVCGSGLLKITQLNDDKGESMLPLKKFRSRFT